MRDAVLVDDVEKYGPDISFIIDYISNVLFQKPNSSHSLFLLSYFFPVAVWLFMEHFHEFLNLEY